MNNKILAYDDGEGGFKRAVFTDADGAVKLSTIDLDSECVPCQCDGGGGCFILVVSCCPCPANIWYIRSGPILESLWNLADRQSGIVAEFSESGCFQYVASVTELPPGVTFELSVNHFIGTYSSCQASPCQEQDCPPFDADGLTLTIQDPCLRFSSVSCVQSATKVYRSNGHTVFSSSRDQDIPHNMSASNDEAINYENGGAGSVEYTGTASGSRAGLEWNESKTINEAGTTPIVVAEDIRLVVCATIDPHPAGFNCDVAFGGVLAGGVCEPYFRNVTTGSDRTVITESMGVVRSSWLGWTASFHASQVIEYNNGERSTFRVHRSASQSIRNATLSSGVTFDIPTEDCETGLTTVYAEECGNPDNRITVDLLDLPDDRAGRMFIAELDGIQYVPTADESTEEPTEPFWYLGVCDDNTSLPVAVDCAGSGLRVLFDPADRPADGVTFLVGSVVYKPTNETETGIASVGVWSPDPCLSNENWYKAVPCGASTPDVPAGFRYLATTPTTDGAVIIFDYPFPANGPNCVVTFAVQPTTQLADLTEVPGTLAVGRNCRTVPQSTSGCVGDSGGPTDLPESPNQSQTTGLLTGRGRFGSDANLDASGFDSASERRRLNSGGCCGQPGNP